MDRSALVLPALLVLTFLTAAAPAAAQIDPDAGPDEVRGAPAAKADGRPLLLYLGDSHTAQHFGQTLDPLLRAAYPGCAVETHGRCGAWAPWFLPGKLGGHATRCGWLDRMPADAAPAKDEGGPRATPVLTTNLGVLSMDSEPRLKAAAAVVALGSNMIEYDKDRKRFRVLGLDSAAALAKTLTDAGVRCLWVGAPHVVQTSWAGADGVEAVNDELDKRLKEASTKAGCGWIDSLDITRAYKDPRVGDGLHYKAGPSAAWAHAVMERIKAAGVLEQACPAPRPAGPDDDPLGGRL